MSELRVRMVRDMTVRGVSPWTHKAYIAAVVGLARYYRRSPDHISADEVQTYIAHLYQDRHRSWSTCSQAAHAFRFFYHVTMGRPRGLPRPRAPPASEAPREPQPSRGVRAARRAHGAQSRFAAWKRN